MSESFKGRIVAPPLDRDTKPAFAAGMQDVPGVPAGVKQQYPVVVSKQAAQGSLQHKRAHMHKDTARQR